MRISKAGPSAEECLANEAVLKLKGVIEMKNGFFSEHWKDTNGNPAGGVTTSRGFVMSWQNGPLGRGEERREPNGAFLEDVIDAVIDRIEFYQASGFACEENEQALTYLREAAEALELRTRRRKARGVEGTHEK